MELDLIAKNLLEEKTCKTCGDVHWCALRCNLKLPEENTCLDWFKWRKTIEVSQQD